MSDQYTAKELIEAIRAVEKAVHELRADQTAMIHGIDGRLIAVEEVVGNESKGLVRRVNDHRREIDKLRAIFLTYLPIIASLLALMGTLWTYLRG